MIHRGYFHDPCRYDHTFLQRFLFSQDYLFE